MAGTDRAKGRPTTRGRVTKPSARYTPPIPREHKSSPRWVPVLMLTLLIGGVVIIMTSYFGLRPGGAQILYLLVGAAFITAGVVALLRFR